MNPIFLDLTLKRKIGTALPFEIMTIFVQGYMKQEGKYWALLYKLFNHY